MEITTELVNSFLNGFNPMEHVISIECDYMDNKANIIYVNEDGEKRVKRDDFMPFLWAKNSACVRMFDGNRGTLRRKMREYNINVKALKVTDDENSEKPSERLENGYKYLFYTTRPTTYNRFLNFFTEAGDILVSVSRIHSPTFTSPAANPSPVMLNDLPNALAPARILVLKRLLRLSDSFDTCSLVFARAIPPRIPINSRNTFIAEAIFDATICTISPKVRPTSALPDRCVFRFLTRLTFRVSTGEGFVCFHRTLPMPESIGIERTAYAMPIDEDSGQLYPSGLTWEDTTASERQESNLHHK